MDIETLQAAYEALPPRLGYVDEQIGRRCCLLAMEALRNHSYGVGAVLLNEHDEILVEGYNRVFEDGYKPAAHAEMELLNDFDLRFPNYGDRSALKLVVLLEPCPMCFSRILLSGIGQVRYLCTDHDGGMVHLTRHLPAVWRDLAQLADVHEAYVSPALREFAGKLAKSGLSEQRKRLFSQIRG